MKSIAGAAAGGILAGQLADQAAGACCYFSAKDRDVNQPAQKAFINWEPDKKRESFTVQPKFEGNAEDFGMVIPTPAQPKLDEMPREFFRMLAVFTILEPMPIDKYKLLRRRTLLAAPRSAAAAPKKKVVVLEEGVVGSLDYKIIKAEDAGDLYEWLDEHDYKYSGDKKTLDHYVSKDWFFTVMKIDSKQMKRRADGTYLGNVTPTRFSFASDELIYPLRITKISVKESTEALFYIQAPEKMDLASFSYQFTWQPMLSQAMNWAVKLTDEEKEWSKHIQSLLPEYVRILANMRGDGVQPTTLEWAKKITEKDLKVIDGEEKFNRNAPPDEVKNLKTLRGHVQKDKFITKFRKVFHTREMQDDLAMVKATAGGKPDPTDYYQILPTSPP